MNRTAITLLLANMVTFGAVLAISTSARASEATVAQVTEISGSVLVSRDFRIASVEGSARLAPGSRVFATEGASATVVFDGGCRVRIASGERLDVVAGACSGDRSLVLAVARPSR